MSVQFDEAGDPLPFQDVTPVDDSLPPPPLALDSSNATANPLSAIPRGPVVSSAPPISDPSAGNPLPTLNTSYFENQLAQSKGTDFQSSTTSAPAPPPQPQYGNDFFGQVGRFEDQLPGPLRAFAHGIQQAIAPSLGAIGAGAAAGALISAPLGELGGIGPLIGAVAGLGAAYLGGSAAQQVQDQVTKMFVPQQDMSAYQQESQQDMQNQPIATALGGLVPNLLPFSFSAKGLEDAARLVGKVSATRDISELIKPENEQALQHLLFVAIQSGQGVQQAMQEIQAGNLQPAVLAIDAFGPLLFNKPRALPGPLGKLFSGGQDKLARAAADGAREGNQQVAAPPTEPTPEQQSQRMALEHELAQAQAAADEGMVNDTRIGARSTVPELQDRVAAAQDALDRFDANAAGSVVPREASSGMPRSMVHPIEAADPVRALRDITYDLGINREQQRAAEAAGQDTTALKLQEQALTERANSVPQGSNQGNPIPQRLNYGVPQGQPSVDRMGAHIDQQVANNPAAKLAYDALGQVGDLHVVGGALRNYLAGKAIKDLDIVFDGPESALVSTMRRLAAANPDRISFMQTGDHFPVYRLNVDGHEVEIALPRQENPLDTKDMQAGGDINTDLARRDFTINGISRNQNTGEIVDPHGGVADVASRTLRTISPTSFIADPLRMLRGLRFIAEGYRPTPEMLQQMAEQAHRIHDVAPERIHDELIKVFSGEHVGDAVRVMEQTGLLKEIFPEVQGAVGFDQQSKWHNQSLFDHLVGVTDAVAEKNSDPDVRMAAFLHDLGKLTSNQVKPEGGLSFHGHELDSATQARQILSRLKYTNDEIDRITFLVRNHMFDAQQVLTHPARFINKMAEGLSGRPQADQDAILKQRINDLMDIRAADQENHANPNDGLVPQMKASLQAVGDVVPAAQVKPNGINFNDIMELGIEDKPTAGKIWGQLKTEISEGQLENNPVFLLQRAKELAGLDVPHGRLNYGPSETPQPNVQAQEAAKSYARSIGLPEPVEHTPVGVDPVAAKARGEAFDKAPVNAIHPTSASDKKWVATEGARIFQEYSSDPVIGGMIQQLGIKNYSELVSASYQALERELMAQFKHLPIKIEWFTENGKPNGTPLPGQPYANSREMMHDVQQNGVLKVFTAGHPHPIFDSPLGPDLATATQILRGVHDYFGHAAGAHQFGPRGEDNAWVEHSKMFTPLAQLALTTETRGHNSWVNFFGDHPTIPAAERPFAEQKVFLLPPEMTRSPLRDAARLDYMRLDQPLVALNSLRHIDLNEQIRNAPANAPELHRGVYYQPESDFDASLRNTNSPVEEYAVGTTHIFPAESWSENEYTPSLYAGAVGPLRGARGTPVIFTLPRGAKAIDTADHGYNEENGYTQEEQEWTTGGKFEVVKSQMEHGTLRVELRQVAPPESGTHGFYDLQQETGRVIQERKEAWDRWHRTADPEAKNQADLLDYEVSKLNILQREVRTALQEGDIAPHESGAYIEWRKKNFGSVSEPEATSLWRSQHPNSLGYARGVRQFNEGADHAQQEAAGQRQEANSASQEGIGKQGSEASNTGKESAIQEPTAKGNSEQAIVPGQERTSNAQANGQGTDGTSATATTGRPNAGTASNDATAKANDSYDASTARAGDVHANASTDAGTATGNGRGNAPTTTDAGRTTTGDGRTTASNDATPTLTTGSGASAERSTANAELAAKAGTTRGSTAADTGTGRLAVETPGIKEAVREMGVDPASVPNVYLHDVEPVHQDEYGTLKAGKLDGATVVLDDHAVPAIVPADPNSMATIRRAESLVGGNVLPTLIHDTPRLIALTLKGWAGRNWYQRGTDFLNTLRYRNDAEGDRVKGLIAAGGENKAVDDNARLAIIYNSRVDSGLLGENLNDRDPLMDTGLLKKDGQNRLNLNNLRAMITGEEASTRKISQYQTGFEGGDGRATIDKWMARIFFNRDALGSNGAEGKALEYAEGRVRYVARALGLQTQEAQAAMWVGYKQLVKEHLDYLRTELGKQDTDAARTMIGELNKVQSALIEGGDFSQVMGDKFGVKEGAEIPKIGIDYTLATWKPQLMDLLKEGGVAYRYLKGGAKVGDDTVAVDAAIIKAFRANPKMRDDLAKDWKQYYVDTSNVPQGMKVALQDLGPAGEAIFYRAYVDKYPQEAKTEIAKALEDRVLDVEKVRNSGSFKGSPLDKFFSQSELHDLIQPTLDKLVKSGIDPYQLHDVLFDSNSETAAYWMENQRDRVFINPHRASIGEIYKIIGAHLLDSLKTGDGTKGAVLNSYAEAKVRKLAEIFVKAESKDALYHLVAHEAIHGMQYRALGITSLHEAPKALLDNMPREWWEGIIKEGMGSEVEAIIHAETGQTLNSWLGGKGEKPGKTRSIMDVEEASRRLIEHLDYQLMHHFEVPLSGYSMASDEVFRRNVYDPKTAEKNAEIAGKWFRQAIRKPEVANRLAAEADLRSARGKLNPDDAGSSESARTAAADDTRAGPAEARDGTSNRSRDSGTSDQNRLEFGSKGSVLDDASRSYYDIAKAAGVTDEIQRLTVRGVSSEGIAKTLQGLKGHSPEDVLNIVRATRDALGMASPQDRSAFSQWAGRLDYGKGAIKNQMPSGRPVEDELTQAKRKGVPLPQARVATKRAAELPRHANENDLQYGNRVAQAAGLHDLETVRAIYDAKESGFQYEPVVKENGAVYTKVNGKLIPGLASDLVRSWHPDFERTVKAGFAKIIDSSNAVEPGEKAVTGEDSEKFADQFETAAGSIVLDAKTGKRVSASVGKANETKLVGKKAPSGSQPPTEVPTQGPPIRPEDFNAIREALPTATLPDEHVAAQRAVAAQDHADIQLAHELHRDQGAFDPEPTSLEKEVEAGKEQAQAEKDAATKPPKSGGPDLIGKPFKAPKGMPKEEKIRRTMQQRFTDLYARLSEYDPAYKAARASDNPEVRNTANLIEDYITSFLKLGHIHDAELDPATRADNTLYRAQELAALGNKIDEAINAAIPDAATQKAITKSIGVRDESERQRLLADLDPHAREMSELLHRTWQVTGQLGTNLGVLKSYLEHYVPLLIKKDAHGKSPVGVGGMSMGTQHAIERVRNPRTGEIFRTPEQLQAYLRSEGLAAEVEENLGHMFGGHVQSMTNAAAWKDYVDQMTTGPEVRFKNGVVARPGGTVAYVRSLPMELAKEYGKIQKGPLQTQTEGMLFHKSVVDELEKLGNINEIKGPGAGLMRGIVKLNTVFKGYKFVLSPVHGISMTSNVGATLGGIKGALGPLGAIAPHRVGSQILNERGDRWREGIAAGLGGDTTPEGLTGLNAKLAELPLFGPVFKGYENLIWHHGGEVPKWGLWDMLSKQFEDSWVKKNPGQPVTPDMKSAFDRLAAKEARNAVGYFNQMDMSKDWSLISNVSFLAGKWTTAQLRTIGAAVSADNRLANLGGAAKLPTTGNVALDKFMADKHVEIARRLVIGGLIRLAIITTLAGGAISQLATGSPSTPVQNYQRDPAHTFDVYMGRDSTTNKDKWLRNPFYLFQREMSDWALAAAKSAQEGRPLQDTLVAPIGRFAGKINPVTRFGFEMLTGRELGRWMNGYGNPDIDHDKNITNITKSLDMMGIPTFGSLGDRVVYAIRSFSPSLGYPINLKEPTTDKGQLAAALGIGTYLPGGQAPDSSVTGAARMGLGLIGSRVEQGTQYVQGPNGEIPLYQSIQNTQAKYDLENKLVQAAAKGDWATVEALRQQGGFTPGQAKQFILNGTTHGGTGEKGIFQGPPPGPFDKPSTGKAAVVAGKTLTPAEQTLYYHIQSTRQDKAIALAMSDPQWASYTTSQKHAIANTQILFADRITNEQFAQAMGRKPGSPISNVQADSMLKEAFQMDKTLTTMAQASPLYASATPEQRVQMITERSAAIREAVWQKYNGNLKGATDYQLQQMVSLQMNLRDNVRQMLPQLPGYSQAYNSYDAMQQENAALHYADSVALAAMKGKTMKDMGSALSIENAAKVVQNGLVLQDAATQMLHQSSVYTDAAPNEQQLLDKKYANLAHNIALYDMRDNVDLTDDANLYKGGFGQALRTSLMADEGFKNLQDQYGGAANIKAHQQELATLKAQFAQEQNIPPSKLAHYDTLITNWYYSNNQDYKQYAAALRTWKSRNPLGQAYSAMSKGMLSYAANDPIAAFAPDLGAE